MVLPYYRTSIMSLNHDSCSPEEMQSFYDGIGPDWTGVETPEFQAAFLGMNASYCTEPIGQPSILTPVSLPDNSFRPSPAVSHHSQEYIPEYQYSSSLAPQGLGITAPFPSDFPVSSAPDTSYIYAPDDLNLDYGQSSTPGISPQVPAPKRAKRASSQPQPKSTRDTPINILPHPEGMERMERERLNPRPGAQLHPRPRAPGRGRRDPQAMEEDAFVEELREQNTAWKVVRELFREKFNKDATEARLQMRLKRRRDQRNTNWEDHDIQLLMTASGMWEKEKYRFIADKMKELGATKEYTPDQCRFQLRLMDTKQYRLNMSTSPSAMTDPPHSPPALTRKRKRGRPHSLDPR